MITTKDAQIYSIESGTAIAYQITYSDDQMFRTVVTNTGWLRNEYKNDGEWKTCKQYIVKKNKNRQGERMIQTVKKFIGV